MKYFAFALLHCSLLLAFLSPVSAFAVEVPANDGYVTDDAGLLSPEEDESFETQLRSYKETANTSILFAIVRSLVGQPIEDAVAEIGKEWGVGGSDDGQSVLVVIAYEDRLMSIDPSSVLGDVLSDEVIAGILEDEMMPSFRDGQYAATINSGITALTKHIGGEYSAERYQEEKRAPWMAVWKALLLLIIASLVADALATLIRPGKAAWFGGLMGLIVGLVLAWRYSLWLAIPAFVIFGFICDIFVHTRMATRLQARRLEQRRRRRRTTYPRSGGLYGE